MTTFQKIIKGLAIAFGVYLSIMIFSAIITVATSILGVTTIVDNWQDKTETVSYTKEYSDISKIDIDINVGNLIIKNGTSFKVEAIDVSKNMVTETEQGKLKIKDKSNRNFMRNNSGKIILYIPQNIILDSVDIESGIGETEIEYLEAKECEMDLGVGKTTISNINIRNKIKISTGTGEVDLKNCNVNNLELDTGVGRTSFNGYITGSSSIEAGMGELDIELLGKMEEYKIITETGIGNINLNNQKISEGTIGTGDNIIRLEGGVGSIIIKTK